MEQTAPRAKIRPKFGKHAYRGLSTRAWPNPTNNRRNWPKLVRVGPMFEFGRICELLAYRPKIGQCGQTCTPATHSGHPLRASTPSTHSGHPLRTHTIRAPTPGTHSKDTIGACTRDTHSGSAFRPRTRPPRLGFRRKWALVVAEKLAGEVQLSSNPRATSDAWRARFLSALLGPPPERALVSEANNLPSRTPETPTRNTRPYGTTSPPVPADFSS